MATSPPGQLAVKSADPGHVIALYNPLIIACFTRAPRADELAVIRALAAQGLSEGIRGGVLYVVARKDMTGGVDPRVRAFFEQMIRENSAKSGGSAVVILMNGFAGAMARSVLAGLIQLTNRRKMMQVFATVDEACGWLAAQYDLNVAALRSVYAGATAHLAG